jgi:hypothetical protein
MLKEINNMHRRGTALLVVLFIVMVATIISLGFLSRSDVELALGENMNIRTEMDYLAESGLEHARGLILNPQDVEAEYWSGAAGQQLVAGGDDYYDVEVVKVQQRNYRISCQAYRLKNGQRTGQSGLEAQVLLYPCIGLWTSNNTSLTGNVSINGDVYCAGTFLSSGLVNGDAFVGVLDASITGKQRSVSSMYLGWPAAEAADFVSNYPVVVIDANNLSDTWLGPYEPVKVCYKSGDLSLDGIVHVNGMLLVDGSLTINEVDNVFVSQKNLPALLVTGDLNIEGGSEVDIVGLAIVYGSVQISGQVDVLGSVFSQGDISGSGILNVTSSGSKSSVIIWVGEDSAKNWSPAAGAVYRSIARQ